jgi:hypothetical protein
MYILVKPKPISSKTRVYLVKSYRDVNGTPKHKIIKNYGSYLELIAKDKRIVEKLQIKANRSTALEEQGKKIIIEPTKYGE